MNFSFKNLKFNKLFKRKEGGRKLNKHFWRSFLIYGAYTILGLVLVISGMFAWFSKDLPTPAKIASIKPAQSTKIYDRTGTILLYETGDQKRTIIAGDQIPQSLKDATVATEDASFYTNHGVNFWSMLSAVKDKLLGHTAVLRGGSTITQQYVKNALLSPSRSIVRKVKEAILAVEVDFMYPKDQILTMYLNEIPYGNSAAGPEAAAQMYYGKSAKNLDLAESATLAGIPQAPTYYSPYGTHVDQLIARKSYVLDRMVKTNKITVAQADAAKKEDTTTVGVDLKPRKDSILAPHFAMYVMEQIANQYGEDVIQKEGLTVITTLDYSKQQAAEAAIVAGTPKNLKYKASNAALVSVDPNTGQILAMVGSKDYYDTSIDGQVNVADSERQPGSSFKPIAYATAFKSPNYSPSKILFDVTTNFGGNPPYIPQNYTMKNYGAVTMRQALDNSLNVPAVKVMSLAGIDNVLQTASDLGITTLTHRSDYGLSLVLGAGEVKPVEMAGAFGVFATGGVKHDLTPVLKITDASNKVVYQYDQSKDTGNQVLDPQIAYEMSNILSDNNARSLVFGTHTALYFPDRTVAVKTGTTSSFKDAWTVGFTPSLATAVWVGNDNDTPMSSGADGSVVAAPIFHNYLEAALKGTPNQDFVKPTGIQTVTVEKYSNKLPSQYSADTTTDIFTSWQVPTTQDDVHQVLNLCKGTDALAPTDTPADLIEQKVITVLHSERPDNPDWENPVQAWLQASGISVGTPPTQTCDLSALQPKITITSPSNNAQVSGVTIIQADAQAKNPISKVEFLLNGVSFGEVDNSPFTISYDFGQLDNGTYTLTAKVTDSSGMTASSDVSVQVSNSTTGISNVSVSNISKSSVSISWNTTQSGTGSISYEPEGSTTPVSASDNNVSLSHSVDLNNLAPNQKYHFTITNQSNSGSSANYSGTFATTS